MNKEGESIDIPTPRELRTQLLTKFRHIARFWSEVPNKEPLDRCEGVTFSILSELDGDGELPPFNLQAQIYNGDGDEVVHKVDLYETGPLHETFYTEGIDVDDEDD